MMIDGPDGNNLALGAQPVFTGFVACTLQPNLPVVAVTVHVPQTEKSDIYTRGLGYKHYEFTDHLGNVRAVVSDRLALQIPFNYALHQPEVLSYTNYYPFGMLMPERVYGSNSYSWGFGGMLKDDEIKGSGNHYTTLFREYDPRLGRWLSIDPESSKLPWSSPYVSMSDNPIYRVDPFGNLDTEYKEVVNEDGTSTKTKISDLGGDEVDFTHIQGGKHDGQTRIESRTTCQEVYMKSSKNIEGFTKRGGGINWNTIYNEFLNGTGPENSLITTPGMLKDIMQSPQFAEAFKAYLGAGAPEKMGYNPSFGIQGAIEAGDNMTAQMIGKASYSFYNVGDKLIITIMDSKSVISYSLNPLVKMLPENWVNKDRSSSSGPVSQGTTRQTYLMILDIKQH